MNINNNFTPLAWHQGDIELQSNRATYAFGHIVPLMASAHSLLPFQIITETGAVDLSNCDVRLRRLDGTDAVGANLRDALALVKSEETDFDVVIYDGHDMDAPLPIGQYYLTLTSDYSRARTWYSDVVTIVADTTQMTKVVWWDVADLLFGAGMIKYRLERDGAAVQYRNWMYFLEEMGMPEYTVEEEGETRDGLFYASKIISGKKYKMQVAQCSEAMCDALRFVHLADFVEIEDGYGRRYNCDSVLITPEWVSGGAVASAAFEITTDTFVKTVGKTLEGYIPRGVTCEIGRAVIGENFMIGVVSVG